MSTPESVLPVDRCASCRAEILWRAHERTGKLAPIDIAPVAHGNVILIPGNRYALDPRGAARTLHYISHYATCPQAPEWRKKAKAT